MLAEDMLNSCTLPSSSTVFPGAFCLVVVAGDVATRQGDPHARLQRLCQRVQHPTPLLILFVSLALVRPRYQAGVGVPSVLTVLDRLPRGGRVISINSSLASS